MRAELKRLHSPDAPDLARFVPEDPLRFSILVQALVGPEGTEAEESFDLRVCSIEWLRDLVQSRPVIGVHHLVVDRYDYNKVFSTIARFCEKCQGPTWTDVAMRLSRLGSWEFDGYTQGPTM